MNAGNGGAEHGGVRVDHAALLTAEISITRFFSVAVSRQCLLGVRYRQSGAIFCAHGFMSHLRFYDEPKTQANSLRRLHSFDERSP